MIFRITMKTPDVLNQLEMDDIMGINDDLDDEIKQVVEKFVRYDEYVIIEFDSCKGTARVVEVK